MYENGIQSALIEVESIRTEEKLWLRENLMYVCAMWGKTM